MTSRTCSSCRPTSPESWPRGLPSRRRPRWSTSCAGSRPCWTATSDGRDEDVVDLNHQIHRTINRLAAAPKLSFLLSVAVRFVPQPFFLTIDGWVSAAVHDHGKVFAAMESHDPEGAREGMRQHILHAGNLLAEHFRSEARRKPDSASPPAAR